MIKMYLVQRGFFDNDAVNNVKYDTECIGRKGIIHLDYMGSAEFEFGVIPSAYEIIMHDMEQYSLFPDVMRTSRGVPVNIFCRNDYKDEVIQALKDYLDDFIPNTIRKYRLREPIKFEYHMIERFDKVKIGRGKIPNFWWDITNQFMFFTGAFDRQKAFHTTIRNDYNNWWLYIDKQEREEKYVKALDLLF